MIQVFHIPVVKPFPWQDLLAYLRLRQNASVESVTDSTYVRYVAGGEVSVRLADNQQAVHVSYPSSMDQADVRTRLEGLFHPQFQFQPAAQQLRSATDIVPLLTRFHGMRPLGAWDAYELCLRTMVGQQVSVAAANTLMQRIGQRAGGFLPDQVAAADLSAIGMPGRRVAALQQFSAAVACSGIDLATPWPDLRPLLLKQPGIGPWTCDYLGIRLGNDWNSFPSSDLGLIRAAGAANQRELLQQAEAWQPHRGLVATLLWMSLC